MEFLLKLKEIERKEKVREEESISKIIIDNTQHDFTIFFEDDKPKHENDFIESCYVKIGNVYKNIKRK